MDIESNKKNMNHKEFSKLLFIYNAIEDGWCVKKKDNKYIFSKHKSKEKRIYDDTFLNDFIKKYFKL